jgi:hypothetical protein
MLSKLFLPRFLLTKIVIKKFAREVRDSIYLKEISKKEINLLKKINDNFDRNSDSSGVLKQFTNLSDEDKMINFQYVIKRFTGTYDPSLVEFINITLPNHFTSLEYLIAFPSVLRYYTSLGQSLPKDYIIAFEKVFSKKGIYLPFFMLRRYTVVYTQKELFGKDTLLHLDNYIIYGLDNQQVKSRANSPLILIDILKEIGAYCSYECFYKIMAYFTDNYYDENLMTQKVKGDLFQVLGFMIGFKDHSKSMILKNFLDSTFEDTYDHCIATNVINRRLLTNLLKLGSVHPFLKKGDRDITQAIVKSLLDNIHSYGIDACCLVISHLGRFRRYGHNLSYLRKDVLKLIEVISLDLKTFDNIRCVVNYLTSFNEKGTTSDTQKELLNFVFLKFVSLLLETNGTTLDQFNAGYTEFIIRRIVRNKHLVKMDNFTMALLKEYYEFLKDKTNPVIEENSEDEGVEIPVPEETEEKLEDPEGLALLDRDNIKI